MSMFDNFGKIFWDKKVQDNLNNPDGMTPEEELETIMFFDYLLQEELNEIEDEEDEEKF